MALTALLAVSCELERVNYTEIYEDDFYKTETDLELAVNSLYSAFDCGDKTGGVYDPEYSGWITSSDMSSDVLWSNWGWGGDELYFHQWTEEQGLQNYLYQAFSRYNFLSKARNVIRNIESSPVSYDVKKIYLGEAHALRGYMGLFLYDMFGPVPVAPDEVLDNPENFVYLPRLSEDEYEEMMEKDLSAAIEMLPDLPTARGRMGKGVARMILLKYYMIKKEFLKAEDIARDLYAMEGLYVLEQDYFKPFSIEGLDSKEKIHCIPANINSAYFYNIYTSESLPMDYPWTEKSEGWSGYVMPWAFYDTFDANDIRRKGLVESYTNTSGKEVTRADMPNGAPIIKYGKDPDMLGKKSGVDVVIYRFSDVLLTLAELIVRNTGNVTPEAVALVDRVRARAGLQGLTPSQTSTVENFFEALLLERGHEFYYEGVRRQDLIRFGKYVEYANDRIEKANEGGKQYFYVGEEHNRFPIPMDFITESKDAIVQNPGYRTAITDGQQ